jgi:hypothetical protein
LVKFTVVPDIPDESMCDEERGSLDRLIRSFVKGRVQIADELSTVSKKTGQAELDALYPLSVTKVFNTQAIAPQR